MTWERAGFGIGSKDGPPSQDLILAAIEAPPSSWWDYIAFYTS